METHRTDNNQVNIINMDDIEPCDDPPKKTSLRKSTTLRNPFFKAVQDVVTVVSSDDDNSNLEIVPVNTTTKTIVDLVYSSDESEQQVSSTNNMLENDLNSSSQPINNIEVNYNDKQTDIDVCNSSYNNPCTLLIGNNKFVSDKNDLNKKSSNTIIDEDVTIIDIPNVLNNSKKIIIESIDIIKPPNSQSELDSNIVEIFSEDSSDTVLTESGLSKEKLLLNEEILLLDEENLLLNEENDEIIDLDLDKPDLNDLTPHYEVIDEIDSSTVDIDLDYSFDLTGDDNLANSTLINQNPDRINGVINEIDTLINAKRNEITNLEQTILTKVQKRKTSLDSENDVIPARKIKRSLSMLENVFDLTINSENDVNLAEIDSCMATVKNEIHDLENTILNRERNQTCSNSENEVICLENITISQSMLENGFDSTVIPESDINLPTIGTDSIINAKDKKKEITDLKKTVLNKEEDLEKEKSCATSEKEFICDGNIKISLSMLETVPEVDNLGNLGEKEKTELKTISNNNRDLETGLNFENDVISSENELISTENELISSKNVLISTENVLMSSENVLISSENDLNSSENDLISPEDIKLSLSMMETEDCETTLISELPEANSTMITSEIIKNTIKPEKPASIKSERFSISSIHSESSTVIKLSTSVLNKLTTKTANVKKRENDDSSIKSENSIQKSDKTVSKTVKRKNNSIKSETSSKKSRNSDVTIKSENSSMRSRSNSSCSNSSSMSNSSTFNNSTRSESTWDYRRRNFNNNNFVPNRSDFRSNCSSNNSSQGWQENIANNANHANNNNNWDNMTQFLNTMTNGNTFMSFSDFAWNSSNNSWNSNAHNAHNNNQTPFRCECCNHFFNTRFDLIRHTRLLSEKRYRCRFCVKPFRFENQLYEHEKEHTGNLPYPCPISYCRKSFRTREMLSLHKNLHDGKVKCDKCDLKFSNEWKLVEHKRLHEGETLLRCIFCDVAYKPNEWDKHKNAFHGHLIDEKFFEIMRVDN